MVEKLTRWLETPPSVPTHNPFTLEKMLSDIVLVYRKLTDADVGRGHAR